MLPAERLERMFMFINEKGFVTINELLDMFDVSKPTVMRDLAKLEKENRIVRSHGGAMSLEAGTKFEPTHSMKEGKAVEKKKKIAEMAITLIKPGETILLDSGSTTLMLAHQLLTMRNITVITNDVKIAMCLCDNEDLDLVVLGGQRRKGVFSLIGSMAESLLKDLCVDKAFMGADAIHIERGITNANLDEVNLKKLMIANCKESILLVDSTKFNNTAFAKVGDIDIVDHIITDVGLNDRKVLSELEEKNVKVHFAD